MAVAIPKLRIKIGPEGPIRIYETFSGTLKKNHSTTNEQSKKKKYGPKQQLENLQAKKKKEYTAPDLRTALAKAQFILNAKYKNFPDNNNKSSYLVRLQMEKEEMETTQLEEKARRIEAAEIRAAAKIDARVRAQTELKQKRERQRIELEEMKPSFYFEENHHLHRKMEKEVFGGCSSLTEIRLLFAKYTGLTFKNDDEGLEEMEDLEEGEII